MKTDRSGRGLGFRPAPATKRRGAVLILVAVLVAVMSAAGAAMLHTAMHTANDLAQLETRRVDAQFLGRAALDAGQAAIETAYFGRTTPPEEGTLDLAGHALDYSITTLAGPTLEQAPEGYRRWFTIHGIEARVVIDGVSQVKRRVVRANQVPLFQYAVFYEGDLRIHPGPQMILAGPVHTNGDLHNRSASGLVFDTNSVRAAGDLFNWCITASSNQVRFRKWVPNPYDPAAPVTFVGAERKSDFDAAGIATDTGGFDSTFAGHDANGDGDYEDVGDVGPWAERALELWGPDSGVAGSGQTVLDATLGAKPIVHNGSAEIQRFVPSPGGNHVWDDEEGDFVEAPAGVVGTHTKGNLHANAELVVDFDGSSWSAFDGDGNDVTATLAPAVTVTTTFNGYANNGGGQVQPTLSIDMAVLATTGLHPPNGLIYLGAPGIGTESSLKHFRLTNGSELIGPLSVASDAPIQVHGDYNVVDKKPAAVMADQVNLLSNAWNNSKTTGTLPRATTTSYNMSVFSGETDATGGGSSEGNGGYHNVLRFHENWSGVPCRIRGSTVIPMTSNHFPACFRGGGHFYNPPRRDFGFDPDLIADEANLPPFTPVGVEVSVIASY
jgi:hypothetical protein